LEYYDRLGKKYFYELLKPLASTDNLTEDDFIDWGHDKKYIKAIGIGECAGVVIDLVSTLFFESEEKLELAKESINTGQWADSIYHSYASITNTAKAILVAEQVKTNSHAKIIEDFDQLFIATGKIELEDSFSKFIYQNKENEPSEEFANKYYRDALSFYNKIDAYRLKEIEK
jgi:sulfite reductase (ferredoxin)